MSENKYWYMDDGRKPSLHRWIFENMAIGAVYAAIVLFGIILFIYLLVGFSSILPEDPLALLAPATSTGTFIT